MTPALDRLPPVVVVVGPTAVGKTGLAVCLAEMAMGLEGGAPRGAAIALPEDLGLTAREFLFNESGGFLVTVPAARRADTMRILDEAGARCCSSGVALAVPMSIPRYTWRESADTISPPTSSAKHTARSVLPAAVGPTMTTSGGN